MPGRYFRRPAVDCLRVRGCAVSAPELLPCPFCGTEIDLLNYAIGAIIICGKCGASMARDHSQYDKTICDGLVTAWNTREDLAPQWQDIATAPKDGTQVDLWSDRGFRYPNAAWDVVDYPMDASGDNIYGWTDSSHHGSIKNGGPYTHWMPLPKPPEAAQ